MFSELPPMIPSFLVLGIPMNLPQSRNRVRQRAPRFREFHLHSTKKKLFIIGGSSLGYTLSKTVGEISQDHLQRK